jgi:TonB family protein
MAVSPAPQPAAPGTRKRVGSFLGWAFLISLVIHAIVLPFVGVKKPEAKKEEVEKVSEVKKIHVTPPTPPPTPTPPPPTPPPKATPPPVKQTNPPPQPKLKVNPPKTTSKSNSSSSEHRYDAPKVGSENGNPQGTVASAPPAPVATGVPATPAPTPVPTPSPTPKPQCANPNLEATTINAVTPDMPDIARQEGATGSVSVKVTLDATGAVTGTEIYQSAHNAALDQAAIAAAKASKYQPEIVNCVKTAGSYIFRVDFTGE